MNKEIKYRVVWGIGCYQDFTSCLDALIFKNKLDIPKGYPNPHISKWVDNKVVDYDYNAKEILNKANCYVGMRDNEEFIECNKQNLFDIIIWVDASDRLPIEENSFNINKSEADIIIENNTTLQDLERKIIRIGKLLI